MDPLSRSLSILALSALFLVPVSVNMPLIGADPAVAKNGEGGNGGGNSGGNGGGNHGSQKSGQTASGNSAKSASAGGRSQSKSAAKRKSAADTVELSTVETEVAPKGAHGLLASELKGLNAVHASPNALEHASPNSQVGRIALYRDAALDSNDAAAAVDAAAGTLSDAGLALSDAEAALAAYDAAYAGRTLTEIDTDIAALDPAAIDYQTQLEALNAERGDAVVHESGRLPLVGDVDLAAGAVIDAQTGLVDADAAAIAAAQVEKDALLTASNGRELSDEAIAYIREQLGL